MYSLHSFHGSKCISRADVKGEKVGVVSDYIRHNITSEREYREDESSRRLGCYHRSDEVFLWKFPFPACVGGWIAINIVGSDGAERKGDSDGLTHEQDDFRLLEITSYYGTNKKN